MPNHRIDAASFNAASVRITKTGAAHFAEAEIGAVMICLTSLMMVLEVNEEK